jgi:hypothetical protein
VRRGGRGRERRLATSVCRESSLLRSMAGLENVCCC